AEGGGWTLSGVTTLALGAASGTGGFGSEGRVTRSITPTVAAAARPPTTRTVRREDDFSAVSPTLEKSAGRGAGSSLGGAIGRGGCAGVAPTGAPAVIGDAVALRAPAVIGRVPTGAGLSLGATSGSSASSCIGSRLPTN